MTDKPKFLVIDGTPPPDTPKQRAINRIKKMPKPAEMLQCPSCGGRELTPAYTGMLYKNGKATGGAKQWLCVLCLMQGRRVVVSLS
ncbi:hypothetical protein D9M71_33940 [compost metagenome]